VLKWRREEVWENLESSQIEKQKEDRMMILKTSSENLFWMSDGTDYGL
jgi:hypothetical protein